MPHLRSTLAEAPSNWSRLGLSEATLVVRARWGVDKEWALWGVGDAGWGAAARLRGALEGVILVGPKAGAGGGVPDTLGWVGGKGGGMLGADCGT